MRMTRLSTIIGIFTVGLIALAILWLFQRQQLERLADENVLLQQQLQQLEAENENLSNRVVGLSVVSSSSSKDESELLRLRGEVGRLRQELKRAEQSRGENRQLALKSQADENSRSATPASAAFQVRLVVDENDENGEVVTNRAKVGDTNGSPEMLHVQKKPLMDSGAIQFANVVTDTATGNALIDIVLTDQGRDLFAKTTKDNVNKRLAILMDGQSYLAPRIASEITGGRLQLSGTFTEEQARELAARINEAVIRQ